MHLWWICYWMGVFYFAKISKLASPLTTLPSCSAFCHLWLCTLSSDLWKQRLGLPPSADSTSCLGQERRSSKNIVALKDCGFRRAYKNPCITSFGSLGRFWWIICRSLCGNSKQRTHFSAFPPSAFAFLSKQTPNGTERVIFNLLSNMLVKSCNPFAGALVTN